VEGEEGKKCQEDCLQRSTEDMLGGVPETVAIAHFRKLGIHPCLRRPGGPDIRVFYSQKEFSQDIPPGKMREIAKDSWFIEASYAFEFQDEQLAVLEGSTPVFPQSSRILRLFLDNSMFILCHETFHDVFLNGVTPSFRQEFIAAVKTSVQYEPENSLEGVFLENIHKLHWFGCPDKLCDVFAAELFADLGSNLLGHSIDLVTAICAFRSGTPYNGRIPGKVPKEILKVLNDTPLRADMDKLIWHQFLLNYNSYPNLPLPARSHS